MKKPLNISKTMFIALLVLMLVINSVSAAIVDRETNEELLTEPEITSENDNRDDISEPPRSLSGNYYINNKLSGKFLRRYWSSTTTVTFSSFPSSNIDDLKWTFVQTGSYYYLKAVFNSNYVLCGDGNSVFFVDINNTSYSANKYKWSLTALSDGNYIIKNAYSNLVLSYYGGLPKLITQVDSSNPNYTNTLWRIVAVSNYKNLTSFKVSNQKWIALNSTGASTVSNISPSGATFVELTDFSWTSYNSIVATVSSSGVVTANSNGFAKIEVTHKPSGIKRVFYATCGQVYQNGEYIIMNRETRLFLDLEGPSYNDNTPIQIWDAHMHLQQRWYLTYQGQGYYTIKSSYSQKYVGVNSNPANYSSAVVQRSSVDDKTKWLFTMTSSGQIKIIPKAGASGSCLAIPENQESNGTDCILLVYFDDNYDNDEWTVYQYGNSVMGVGVWPHNGYHLDYVVNVLDEFSFNTNSNNKSVKVYMEENISPSYCLDNMENCNVFYSFCHGGITNNNINNGTFLVLTTGSNISYYRISSASDIYDFSSNTPISDFSNADLMVYVGCNTGIGTKSMVHASVAAGAACAVGFTSIIEPPYCLTWLETFFQFYVGGGYTVNECCYYACESCNSQGNTDSFIVL